jgi:hypothetical protein
MAAGVVGAAAKRAKLAGFPAELSRFASPCPTRPFKQPRAQAGFSAG